MCSTDRASQVALVVKNPLDNPGHARNAGSVPGWGRPLGGGPGNHLQYSCLESTVGKGAWQATVWSHKKSDRTEVTEHACTQSTGNPFSTLQ